MKKLLQILTAALVSVMFIGAAASAQSLPDCDVLIINNTGPGSNNQVECVVTVDVNVVCENNVYVLDTNSQNAASGAASSQGNVTSGTVITGNATNSNNQTVQIGASCDLTSSPSPTPTPVTPGGGSVTPPAPAALPVTAGANAAAIVMASLAAAAIVVAISRLAVAAYRRINTK